MKRTPVPTSHYELFKTWLVTHAHVYGVRRDKVVSRCIDVLTDELDRHVWEAKNPRDMKGKLHKEVQQFIGVWQEKYHAFTQSECPQLQPKEIKCVQRVCALLAGWEMTPHDFVGWLFTTLSRELPRMFAPPSLMTLSSTWVTDKYRFQRRNEIDNREAEAKEKMEAKALLVTARALCRKTSDATLLVTMEGYNHGSITLSELRTKVREVELSVKWNRKK